MDIKHIRRLVARRLDEALETLQELRSDIGTFEQDETWLADGLEVVLENISQLAAYADAGDFKHLAADDEESVSEESDDEGDDDVDFDEPESDRELDFALDDAFDD